MKETATTASSRMTAQGTAEITSSLMLNAKSVTPLQEYFLKSDDEITVGNPWRSSVDGIDVICDTIGIGDKNVKISAKLSQLGFDFVTLLQEVASPTRSDLAVGEFIDSKGQSIWMIFHSKEVFLTAADKAAVLAKSSNALDAIRKLRAASKPAVDTSQSAQQLQPAMA